MKTDDVPVTGSTCKTLPAPKSITSRKPCTGLKPRPSIWGLELAIATLPVAPAHGRATGFAAASHFLHKQPRYAPRLSSVSLRAGNGTAAARPATARPAPTRSVANGRRG